MMHAIGQANGRDDTTRIVRAHNVHETVDALRMVEAIQGWREPAHLVHNMRPEGNE